MQDQASQHVVRECPLLADRGEFVRIGRVGLDAQGCREHELAHRRAEAGEERIEGLHAREISHDRSYQQESESGGGT